MACSPSTCWVPGAGRPAGAPQQAPVTGPPSCQLWDNQHGQEPGWRRASTDCTWLLAAWSRALPQQCTSQGGLKGLKPSTTSTLKDTTHRGSSSNLPEPIHSHLLLLQVLHHWQQCKACFSSRAFHHQLHSPYFQSFLLPPPHLASCLCGPSFPPAAFSCPSPPYREICPFGTTLSQLQELAFQPTHAFHFEFKVSSPWNTGRGAPQSSCQSTGSMSVLPTPKEGSKCHRKHKRVVRQKINSLLETGV